MPDIRMPKMGDGMEEGTILRWLKQVGDTVAVEEAVAEIETDKATVEMPSEDAGQITAILVQAGETVPVGAVIARIGGEGSMAGSSTGVVPERSAAPIGEAGPALVAEPTSSTPPTPVTTGKRVRVSPLARRAAEKMGVDLSTIRGTGGGIGRIVLRDVLASAEPAAAPLTAPASPSAPVAPASAPPAPATADAATDISKMRRAIARRTLQSKLSMPHFYLVMPVIMDRALELVAEMKSQSPDQKVTINDLFIRASAAALVRYPDVNVSFTDDDRIVRHSAINIGIAVGTDDGLRIPVLRDCGTKTLRQLSVEARGAVERTRNGLLTPQDMSGGTFTISNLGMFGIEEFMAIINPPEAAILAVGAVQPEVTVDADGSFKAVRKARITLSCDHRAVDGVAGSKFLQEIRNLLENPLNLLA